MKKGEVLGHKGHLKRVPRVSQAWEINDTTSPIYRFPLIIKNNLLFYKKNNNNNLLFYCLNILFLRSCLRVIQLFGHVISVMFLICV
jgi:hypothetical protein